MEATQTTDPKGMMDSLDDLTREAFAARTQAATAPTTPAKPQEKAAAEKPAEQPKAEAKTATESAETKTAAEDQDEIAPPETATPKQKLDWSRATDARKQIKAENKRLKEQLEKAKPDAALESLRKENLELQKQLESVAIERSPRFRSEFEHQANAITESAKQSVPKIADKLDALLRLPPGDYRNQQIDALAEDLSASQVTALNVALLDMDKLNHRKNLALTEQREQWLSSIRQEETRKEAQAREQKEEWRRTFESTLASAQENLPVYQLKDGDEEWNKEVEASIALAQRVYIGDDMEPVDLAKTALWAAAAPRILAQNLALMKELEGFKQKFGEIEKATPSPGAGTTAQSAASDNRNFIDTVLEEGMKAGLLRARR